MNIHEIEKKSNELLTATLAYAQQNWRIVPLHSFADGLCTCENPGCDSPAKHPLTPRGVHDATTDAATLRDWWRQASIANVGIATGGGLLVLDVDAKSGGLVSLANLERTHGPLPLTPTVATGGGGRHVYFRHPEGVKIGNRAGVAPGVDIRSDGGYVVAPPSLHASGKVYEWLVPPEKPLAAAPQWLIDLLTGKQAAAPEGKSLLLTVQPPTEDLTNHPGAAEGERNATLCRLAGVHLARGETTEAIEQLAVAWAERCTPPMLETEVIRTVSSLAAKHGRAKPGVAVQPEDEIDSLPLPEPPPWPTMKPAAYHGLAGEIVSTLEPATEADPVAILLTFLACFGNAIGRIPYFQVEGDKHYPNLFAVLVGESSRARKGTSLGRGLSLFEDVDSDWKKQCVGNGLSSGEGLIWAVRDPITALEPRKEKGQVLDYQLVMKDHGIEDKRLLVSEPEFAQALRVMRREGNTLSPIIRQAWDTGTMTALTKNNLARATDAHISILGHITQLELAKNLDDTNCFNGFANRFLWALVKRSKLLPEGGQVVDLQPIKERLAAAYRAAKQITAMSRDPEARALWRSLYPLLTSDRPGLYGAVTGRAEAQTLRLSMLYALLDGSAKITVSHLQAAVAAWRYCQDSARIIFTQSDGETADPLEKMLLAQMRKQPGINRRGLHKALGGHVPASAMVEALGRLRVRRQARCEPVSTGGRPSECWWACEQQSQIEVPSPFVEHCSYARQPEPQPVAPVQAAPVANERAKPLASAEGRNSDSLCSFARSPKAEVGEAAAKESGASDAEKVLTDFYFAVQRIGGRVRKVGDRVVLDAPADKITPDLQAAFQQHYEGLKAWLMTDEDFDAALRSIPV